MFIDIAFHGAHAVVADTIHIFFQMQTDTETRQHREFRTSFHIHFHGNHTLCIDHPCCIHLQDLLYRIRCQRHSCMDHNTAILLFYFCFISTRFCFIISCTIPFQFDIHIIICRCAPDIHFHRFFDLINTVTFQFCEQTCTFIQTVTEVFAAYHYFFCSFFYLQIFACFAELFQSFCNLLISAVSIFQRDFIKAKHVACRNQCCRIYRIIADLQECTAFFRYGNRYFQHCCFKRSDIVSFQFAGLQCLTIAVQFIHHFDFIFCAGEIQIVLQCNLFCCLIKGFHSDRTVNIFVFHQACVRSAVRIYQTVHAEVAVMYFFAVVTAVVVHCSAVFCLTFIDCMIAPFPYKAAAHDIIFMEQLEMVFEVAGAVTHRMAVFDQDKRLVRIAV